jgi:large subunit ribosomal protein L29
MNTVEKIRNTTDAELRQQERDLMDQLFRLKFQMKMGQTESLNKIRGLRKDVARVKTIARERALGLHPTAKAAKPGKTETAAPAKVAAPAKAAKAKSAAAKAPAKKSAAKKK